VLGFSVFEGVYREMSFLVTLCGKPFHDIDDLILLISFWRSSSVLQILWAQWISACIQAMFLDHRV
jgi:hypothetical protein